jgi:5-methylcytosine-specific restriction enzyme subunit McrC
VLHATAQHELEASQYVGVVRLGKRTIQVLPKIHQTNSDEEKKKEDATRALISMLSYAGNFDVRETDVAPLLLGKAAEWFEILTALFAVHLKREWQNGAHRTYQAASDVLPVLKGRWRIADQLRRPERKQVFEVTYDEFTADNQLNRVFRFVVEMLWKITRQFDSRRALGLLREWMDEVTLVDEVDPEEAAPALLTRLNQRYEPLLNLARLFLEMAVPSPRAGNVSTFAFVFDMNQLFESFISNFIRRHRSEILPSRFNACELLVQSAGAVRALAQQGDREVFHLKPDILFRSGHTFPLIIDTKYKMLGAEAHSGVSQADFYQMYAYANRYCCDHTLLLFPQSVGMAKPVRERFSICGTQVVVWAATVDLTIGSDTRASRDRIKKELRELLEEI